ncbi:hypothetical protein O3P69_009210 [Scylla paramamosain]|uniref:Sepiapterin reductase n=1 Tax=Scylla paramamosain TaxID=85552 RepID=A0AAW0TA90_SCYPA
MYILYMMFAFNNGEQTQTQPCPRHIRWRASQPVCSTDRPFLQCPAGVQWSASRQCGDQFIYAVLVYGGFWFSPVVMDLATAKAMDYEATLKDHLGTGQSTPPGQALLFHNAGSLGTVKYLREMDDATRLSTYFDLNISSVILLNAAFMRLISTLSGKVIVKVINVSSLCALEPFKSWGLYCTGKAGRDMLFKVLAVEDPGVRVLNYAPGPLDTGMQVHARTMTQDDDIRKTFTSMKEEGKLLSCQSSVKKLLQFLEKDEFKSGDHVDFFEV